MKAKLIGKCIYCLSPDASIGEHVIPKSLGGLSTLQKASCLSCAAITSKIILRTTHSETSLFGRSRIILKMPTRRIKDRATKLNQTTLGVEPGGRKDELVPAEELIDTVMLPIYPVPGVMSGKQVEAGIITTEMQFLHANMARAQKGKSYRTHYRWRDSDLPMLLATIAYCVSVDEFGLDDTYPSPLLKLILGEKQDAGNWIGVAPGSVMKKRNKFVDVVHLRKDSHMLVRIKFFAWMKDSPEYLVVVR